MAAVSMKRFFKEKKKCLRGDIAALPKGLVSLALRRINIYVKQLAPCCQADCLGGRGEIGQQGVGWPPNPLGSQGSGPDRASRSGARRPLGMSLAVCAGKPVASKVAHKTGHQEVSPCRSSGRGFAVERAWRSAGRTGSPNVLLGRGPLGSAQGPATGAETLFQVFHGRFCLNTAFFS